MIEAVNWAALEAIGTVGAVVVALALAVAPAWRRWTRRPKLTLLVSEVEPHCVAIAGKESIVESVVLRGEVRNDGKRAAQCLSAKMTGHWIEDLPTVAADYPPGFRPHRTVGWRLRETEPVALKVASGTNVTIAPGQSEFVCLVSLRRQDLALSLCLLDPEHSIVKASLGRALARHRVRVVVTAQDAEPVVAVVEFVVNGKNFISDVAISKVPSGADDTRLLTLLRQMVESPDVLVAPSPESAVSIVPGREAPVSLHQGENAIPPPPASAQ